MTTDITELALIAKIKNQLENFDTVVLKEAEANALVEALETKDADAEWMRKRIAELAKARLLKEIQRANWFQVAQELGEDLDAAEKRIAELERQNSVLADGVIRAEQWLMEGTVTVKIPYLPDDCDRTEAHYKYQAALTAAGIKWEAE
ncbi:TPA: hypothetical protein QFV83_003880 [Klebsiella aerogenes]|nr:hypothetical protein [Klebsiella aerogenes]